jgi:hypothetical protein
MKIPVRSKNEFRIIPDFYNNLQLEPKDQFVIVLRKLSNLETSEWSSFNSDGEISIDMKKRIESSIVRLENPPVLVVDDKEHIELTKEVLVSGKYVELYELETFLTSEITNLNEGTEKDKKK